MSLITLNNIFKDYINGEVITHALKGITLSIESKSFLSFIGPSGSGKTTLLNLIGCLDKPDRGTIHIEEQAVAGFDRKSAAMFRSRAIGFIFQNFNLIPVLTVYENIEYPLILAGNVPAAQRRERVLELLEKTGMSNQKDKFPSQISGGQKQRVSIARALVTNPKIVLADEPTANLDHDTAYKIISIMHEMKNTFQTTFIFSTHDPKIVNEAEQIYTLEDGSITGFRAGTGKEQL
ncbi:MAG: ABC transporter [Spirochaetes bacterium GWF1_41_5]|nr:MAG: ABC transporter [Spirochaetes bacterium GWF1_41_5]HBE03560.1 ABC transporter [Spirochaetia bacterium]